MSFDIKGEILSQIGKTSDETMRTVLLLMLGVLDMSVQGIEKLSVKIDNLITDEEALRKTVLNGLAKSHDREHADFREHLRFSEEHREMIERAKPLMAFVEKMMIEQEETKKLKKSLFHKFLETLVDQSGVIIMTALITYLGIKVF